MLSEGREPAGHAGWEGSEALGPGAGSQRPRSQFQETDPVLISSFLDLDSDRVTESLVPVLSAKASDLESGFENAPTPLVRLEQRSPTGGP